MVVTTTADIAGHPMSWDAFLALPDGDRVEFTQGRAVVSPPPTFAHQEICLRLRDALRAGLGTDTIVAVATGWVDAAEQWTRIPDLMVLGRAPADGAVVTEPPLVVVEVLSSNRRSDLVVKAVEYHREGAGQYWVVDPRDQTIDVFVRAPAAWHRLHRMTVETPTAEVSVGEGVGVRRFTLRLPDILR
jgi:Uma2 family endonuclease